MPVITANAAGNTISARLELRIAIPPVRPILVSSMKTMIVQIDSGITNSLPRAAIIIPPIKKPSVGDCNCLTKSIKKKDKKSTNTSLYLLLVIFVFKHEESGKGNLVFLAFSSVFNAMYCELPSVNLKRDGKPLLIKIP